MPGRQHFLLQSGEIPLRATFSSSPDRGLSKLLDLWPEVCNMVPRDRPELHVYYGFDNWRKIAELQGAPPHVLRQIDRLEARVKAAPNVVYHGRAGQAEVARSYLRSQLWLYPTDFEETSCITAMEAQAAGCKVVAARCGAVPETAPDGYFVDGPATRPGFDARFLEHVRAALVDDCCVVKTPRSWADVAREWVGWL
jgi:glycosyltransferase involved in cell wall biosynthesis